MGFSESSEHFRRSVDQHSCEIDGEIAILSLKTKEYFGLTEVGAFVWQELECEKSFDELTYAVLAEFEIDEETCRSDLTNLLKSLKKAGLMQNSRA